MLVCRSKKESKERQTADSESVYFGQSVAGFPLRRRRRKDSRSFFLIFAAPIVCCAHKIFPTVNFILIIDSLWSNNNNKMAVDRKQANMKALSETADVQEKTKETIFRIQRTAAETEAIGAQTLEELRRQGAQMVSFMPVQLLPAEVNSPHYLLG